MIDKPLLFLPIFGGSLYHLNKKITELCTPKKFDCRYLQKDSLKHFEIYSGN